MSSVHRDPVGRWEFLRELSTSSGQGWVLVVRDTTGQKTGEYVRKVLKSPKKLDRFKLEVQTVLTLASQNCRVAPIVDYYYPQSDNERAYYVSPYYKGGDLRATIPSYSGNLPKALSFLRKLYHALRETHTLAAHRDLKPENILLDSFGDPVLCDYGLVFPLEGIENSERVSESLEQIGSRHYMAPEALAGAKHIHIPVALDVYAFGKIAYELASGVLLPGIALPTDEWDLTLKYPGCQQDAWFSFNCLVADLVAHDPWDRMMAWNRAEGSFTLIERLVTAQLSQSDPDQVEVIVRRAMGTKRHIVEAKEHRDRIRDASAYGDKISECIVEAFTENPTIRRLMGMFSGEEPPISVVCGTNLATTWPREMGLADQESVPVTSGCPHITATCVSLMEPMVRLVAYIYRDGDAALAVRFILMLADYSTGWVLREPPLAEETVAAIPIGEMVSLPRIKELARQMADRWVELFISAIQQ